MNRKVNGVEHNEGNAPAPKKLPPIRTFTVMRPTGFESPQAVEAHRWYTERCGALMFERAVVAPDGSGFLLRIPHAFAAGTWTDVLEVTDTFATRTTN